MNGWLWLALAGVFEVGFTTALKLEQQDSRYIVAFLICAVFSFEALSRAIKTIPLSVAYAVWTGIGAVGTVIVGASMFGESLSPIRMVLLTLLIAVLIGLKLAQPGQKPAKEAAPPGKEEAAGGAGEL
ncbi:Quaternary ammonium compound-resistance protein SugE [Deinococcus marmoris]|uniref:Quaternary ammonium compound-resistance protein SugE n=1 Tax=Deinococcus marmoris TaxID=249408 RepID=A0A1U7NYG0_9DEIO|nr:Quaternary ammonium compound-resistance protein SugE [Deinococcus marmoris]